MDKGYHFPDIIELVKEYGYTSHIRSHGEENIKTPGFGQEGGLSKGHILGSIDIEDSLLGGEN